MSRGRRARAAGLMVVRALAVGAAAFAVAAAAQADDQWWHIQWRMDEVWQITDGSGVTVAVLDSGVDASVPELAGAVVPGTDFIGGGTDGRVDVDDPGHGTGVASLIAGRDVRGFRGVAPGATILPVTVSIGGDEGPSSEVATGWYADGIRYATDNGAQVINMSVGTLGDHRYPDGCPDQVAEAVRYAASRDVIVVASSGNTRKIPLSPYPGSCPGVVTVGATDAQAAPWDRSHGSEYVDVTGPGVGVSVVVRGGEVGIGDGTSFATALVSGVIALVRAEFPDASADEVLARVFHTVRDLEAEGRDDVTGYGIVRPYHALTESVPADAPNPAWEGMGDSAEVDGTDAGEPAPTTPAVGAVPPTEPESNGRLVVLLAVGGVLVLLLLAGGGVAVAVVLARSRRPAIHPNPYHGSQDPGPGDHRGPPAPPGR